MRAYRSLEQLFARLSAIGDATGILGWDAQTLMPVGAAEDAANNWPFFGASPMICSSRPSLPTCW